MLPTRLQQALAVQLLSSKSSECPAADLMAMLRQRWTIMRSAQHSSSRQGQSQTAAPCSQVPSTARRIAAQAGMAVGRLLSSCAFSVSSR